MLAHLPLTTPSGTQLRGPEGSLRCSIRRGPAELVASLLRQSSGLFPTALRYSPAQMGLLRPCSDGFLGSRQDQTTKPENHAVLDQ